MQIYTPNLRAQRVGIVRQWLRGVVACGRMAEVQEPAAFFGQVYATGQTQVLTDGNLDWYVRPLAMLEENAPALFENADAHALDIGTGLGTACDFLYAHGWRGHTCGVDVVGALAAHHAGKGPRHSFMQADLNRPEELVPPAASSLIVAINALVYLDNPAALLKHLRALATPDAYLMVIEPQPSLYWQPRARAQIRPPRFWQEALAATGWQVVEEGRIAAFACAGRAVLPIAQAYLAHAGK